MLNIFPDNYPGLQVAIDSSKDHALTLNAWFFETSESKENIFDFLQLKVTS